MLGPNITGDASGRIKSGSGDADISLLDGGRLTGAFKYFEASRTIFTFSRNGSITTKAGAYFNASLADSTYTDSGEVKQKQVPCYALIKA